MEVQKQRPLPSSNNVNIAPHALAQRKELHAIMDLVDAVEAGGRNSEICTLILAQGDYARNIAIEGRYCLGCDYHGVYTLRWGKLLNVRKASRKQILKDKDFQNIIKILGLQPNKEYTDVKSLRYGHLMILADQGHHGYLFKGLLINFIHFFWPSLLKVPSFISEFITPIVKAFHSDGKKKTFSSMPEFEEWSGTSGDNANGWKIKYHKSLATCTFQEGREYFRNIDNRKFFVWIDDEDGSAIELAFSKQKAKDRKAWICNFKPGTCRDYRAKSIRYRDFVNKELILSFRAKPQLSIASMVDGLKPPQRKILFFSFKKKLFEEIDVDEFIRYVSEHSPYHPRLQSSVASAIINMAHDYVGSNNINLLKPISKFGTCNTNGNEYSPDNYLYTELSPITRCLFPEDDDKLLDYLNEYGKSIEPNWYMPVIPMVLVNGSEGSSKRLSSFIPNYNPREIIANIRRLLNGGEVEPMDPWYKGFKGTIERSAEEGGYVINGTIKEVDDQTYRITELPIQRWTEDYELFLESIAEGGTGTDADIFIEDFWQNGDDVTVDIEVKLKQDKITAIKQECLLKKFKLTRTISTSNMHLFDAEGKIKKYDNPEQILKEFFQLRLEYYERRKKHKLENLEQLLLVLDENTKFISELVHREFDFKMELADLLIELERKGFTPMPRKSAEPQVAGAIEDNSEEQENGDYDYLKTYLDELAQELLKEMEEKTRELKILKATSPTSMWNTDLDELEKKLDELESKEAEDERKRSSQATKAAPKMLLKSIRNIPMLELLKKLKEERKRLSQATKAATKKRNSSMEVVAETEEQPRVPAAGKKECGKKAAQLSIVVPAAENADDDFELHKQAVPETGKKKRGREPAAENAWIFPKKAKKLRASPSNMSGSLLAKVANKDGDTKNEELLGSASESS